MYFLLLCYYTIAYSLTKINGGDWSGMFLTVFYHIFLIMLLHNIVCQRYMSVIGRDAVVLHLTSSRNLGRTDGQTNGRVTYKRLELATSKYSQVHGLNISEALFI